MTDPNGNQLGRYISMKTARLMSSLTVPWLSIATVVWHDSASRHHPKQVHRAVYADVDHEATAAGQIRIYYVEAYTHPTKP